VAGVKKKWVVRLTRWVMVGQGGALGMVVEDFDGVDDEFLGTHMHAMDAKGRLVLPADHRSLLEGGKLVMTLGFDRTVDVHPIEEWQTIRASVAQMQRSDLQQRRMARAIYANASKQVLDKQGRISIPAKLREICGLTRDVAVVGMGDHIEIWDAERWAAEEGASRDTYENTRESLGIGMF
jgi:MraZ protein